MFDKVKAGFLVPPDHSPAHQPWLFHSPGLSFPICKIDVFKQPKQMYMNYVSSMHKAEMHVILVSHPAGQGPNYRWQGKYFSRSRRLLFVLFCFLLCWSARYPVRETSEEPDSGGRSCFFHHFLLGPLSLDHRSCYAHISCAAPGSAI